MISTLRVLYTVDLILACATTTVVGFQPLKPPQHPSAGIDPRRQNNYENSIGLDSGTSKLTITQATTAETPDFDVSLSDDNLDSQQKEKQQGTASTTSKSLEDMPWSEMQAWALRDNISKYTIQAPIMLDGKETVRAFTLWHTLTDEVPELSGYPLSFLVDKHRTAMREQQGEGSSFALDSTCRILPYLDQFSFQPDGGLSGLISGVTGVADGTMIRTTPVIDVQTTIPKGYARTVDGSILYELGRPASFINAAGERVSLDGAKSMATLAAQSLQTVTTETASSLQKQTDQEGLLDSDLINLAGFTGVVLASATAMNMLSHHLTVNVFWV